MAKSHSPRKHSSGYILSDPNNGTAVRYFGTIIRTTDGGTTWVNQESGTMEILRNDSFADANNATAVGETRIILNTKNSKRILECSNKWNN